MAEAPGSAAPPPAPAAPKRDRPWGRRIVIWGIGLLAAVVLFFVGAAYLPRWWAHRIGDQVDESTAQGVGVGLFYGIVFTFLPLLVLWLTFRRRRPWKVWAAGFVGAVILAAPNLLTLGIVIGTGSAAHAGERTLDVKAPYFRGSTLIGAILAAAAFLALQYILVSRRRGKRTEARLRDELKARDAAEKPDVTPE